MSEANVSEADSKRRMTIFRAKDARNVDSELMPQEGFTSLDREGLAVALAAGLGDAYETKLLLEDPVADISLTYAWIKGGYQLPRHSHSADCWYYLISGQAHVGNEVLGQGDGFFVPADSLYTFRAGDDGMEVIEFRTAAHFNIRVSGNSAAFWSRLADVARERHGAWKSQPRPEMARRFP